MKKLLTILFTFIALSVSAQNTHKQSNANTVEQFQGAVETKVGLINAHFSDTTEANLSWIKTKPFAQIVTGDGVTWLRNGTATKWIGTGSASINISSDSTSLIICNGSGTCDTIPVLTVAPITTFNILNDTTIEVCGINSCDTIYTLPINYNQNVVNSVSVVNGVSVDSVFYFINGVKYLAGTITHSSANTSVDGLISGGIVSWSGAGLTFDIQAAVFRIFGTTYYTRDTTITLDPADPTYSRIDLFALDTTNGGEVIKITGTPSPTPVAPQTQDFQIALTTGITLNVGDTVPSNVSIQKIYDENIEWATSTNGSVTVNYNDTTNPFTGSKDALVSSYNNVGRLIFTRPSTGTIQGDEVLKMRISLKDTLPRIMWVTFLSDNTILTNWFKITPDYGLANKINKYQTISIPIWAFTFLNHSYNKIIIYATGYDTSGTGGFYLDDVELQSGINNIPSPTDYSNKADSTTTKKLNDSTYVGLYWVKGIPYQKGDTIKIHSTTIDSINVSILNGGKIDTSHLPVSNIYIQQAGAGETHIVRAANDTTLSVATFKNTDDITPSKNADSSISFNFTNPHYTKDQVDSIAATLTASGITRAELIDTADNKVNKTDISGGTINQVLKKNSSTDYDWSWQDESGGSTIDTSGKWLSDADSVAPNTIRFYKGTGYKDFVFTGVDTSNLSDRIDANTSSITTKFNISDSTGKWFSWGYKRNDSVFLCKNTTCTFIFKDSSGGGGSTYTPTDTAFKLIRAQGLYSSYNPSKGIRLENSFIDGTTQQNAPPLVFKASQNGNPYWYKIAAEGWVLKIQYSSDSINYSNGFTMDRLGAINMIGGAASLTTSSYVSANQFTGAKMNFLASSGYGVIGANRQPNPNASFEIADSTRGLLINRVTSTNKKKITTSVSGGTITNGGSGYTNGTVTAAFSGGSGTGQNGLFTVSGGVITAVSFSSVFANNGMNYKVGDVLSASFGGGTGFSYIVTKLAGDTSNGLMVVDTSLNCLSIYNKSQQKWENIPTSNTYTASGDGTSTTITVPHGLNNVTSSSLVWVNAKNAASASITYTTIDATNVYIHYTTAPISGTNNLLYDIQIKKE